MRAIVTFHSIDDTGSVLSFPQRALAQFLEGLAASRISVCALEELLQTGAQRAVALVFDDGMQSVFRNALPVLKDFAVPAHLFLTVGAVGRDNRWPGQPAGVPRFEMLSWPQVEALHAAGIRIEGHTAKHPDLCALDDAAVVQECQTCDDVIERRLGRRPQYFAYPYGNHDRRVRAIARQRYAAAVTTELRPLRARDDPAALPRLDSYYLRPPWLRRRFLSPEAQAYLALRNALRRIRGSH